MLSAGAVLAQTPTSPGNVTAPPTPEPFGGNVNESDSPPVPASAGAQPAAPRPGCEAEEGESSSETEPVEGASSGTAPGGSGSSGWTGGLGGSDIGTSQSETSPDSVQRGEHPQVAGGLDPISGETATTGPASPPPVADEPQEDATDPC
ncbi:hypothetical protein [Aureimonas populi]|nr:hypothetical protein [Aureimonas populi]